METRNTDSDPRRTYELLTQGLGLVIASEALQTPETEDPTQRSHDALLLLRSLIANTSPDPVEDVWKEARRTMDQGAQELGAILRMLA